MPFSQAYYSFTVHIWHAVKQMYSFSQIETRNRFRCLRSKPVDVEEKKVEREVSERTVLINEENLRAQSPRTQSLKEREEFHDTFSFLIKLVSILNLLRIKFSSVNYNILLYYQKLTLYYQKLTLYYHNLTLYYL